MSLRNSVASEPHSEDHDEAVLLAPARCRRVEKITALRVAMMEDAQMLPHSGRFIAPGTFGFRFPTLADMMAVSWAVEWNIKTPLDQRCCRDANGVLGYVDHYDMHTSSDVREIAYIAGSARAVVSLFRWAKCDAALDNRRVIGSFDTDNGNMLALMMRLGAVCTRLVFEAT